jgi:hypothetical protein
VAEQHHHRDHGAVVGLSLATVGAVIPESWIDPIEKIAIAAIIALVSGFLYRLGSRIADKLGKS